MIQGKVWGRTRNIFNKNNVEIHRIEGRKGCYCSEHMHMHKHNMFWVESGRLKVIEWKEESGTVDVTELSRSESCVVPPGSYHKFEVIEDCVAYEIYWVELMNNDIARRKSGGTPAIPGQIL